MENERSHVTERILQLALEIIFLLTGENYKPVKETSNVNTPHSQRGFKKRCFTEPFSPFLTPENHQKNNGKKILEIANKIIELLTREAQHHVNVEITGGDEETHVTEDEETSSMCGSTNRSPMEKCPSPPLCQGFAQEHNRSLCDNQDKHQIIVKGETQTEKKQMSLMSDVLAKEEAAPAERSRDKSPPEICTDPLYSPDPAQEHHNSTYSDQGEGLSDVEVEVPEEARNNVQCKKKKVPTNGSGDGDLPQTCQNRPCSPDSAQELQKISQTTQSEALLVVKVEDMDDEEEYGRCHEQTEGEEQVSTYIGSDGRYSLGNMHKRPVAFQVGEAKDDTILDSAGLCHPNLSSCQSSLETPTYKISPQERFSKTEEPLSYQTTPTGEDTFSWSEGEEGFTQKSHQDQNWEGEAKPYSCSICGKSFRVKSVLIRHEKVHTGEKPYECSQCGKSFAQKSDLAEHERIHTGEKPYPCPECGKSFAKKTNLARHLRMHSGVKPYACSICEKAFTQKAALDEHVRIHTGEKPYACTHCGKCFAQKSAYAEHQRVHTGERPYACAECGKCFTQGSALAKHQRVHQNQKPRSCPQCGKLFPSDFLLALHERVHQANYQYLPSGASSATINTGAICRK
ncbi:zinc finger protein 154-like [Hyperolius riggenbachi]|uniref:zinc finger protein 154-like n=1 Tax=Hyperolius riggenbachi TaxID=752182 RepID=UPI0035A2EC34